MWDKFKKRLTKRGLNLAKSDSGAVAVEFAFVALPFFMLLGVILEQGTIMFVEYTMQAAVQSSARLIRTGQAQAGAFSAADFKSKICSLASQLINCTDNVTVYVASGTNFATLKGSLPSFVSVGTPIGSDPVAPASYKCGGPLQTAAVVATFDWNFIMPFMSFESNVSDKSKRRLVAFAMFQNEPFPSGSSCK